MSGYGILLKEDAEPVPRVLKIPTVGELEWQPAAHPLHNRIRSDRFGLGLPFAVEYLRTRPGVVVGLIPVAWGGAGIDRLNRGTDTYADALRKIAFAGEHGLIKGVLWHQGETDTKRQRQTEEYEEKLHQLISDLRADTGKPDLPFIAGNLAEFYGTGKDHSLPDYVGRIDRVRQVLRDLPRKVEHTGFVESAGCVSHDHHMVHFDRDSYILLGKRYAEEFNRLTGHMP